MLNTSIAGYELSSCIYNASGCLCTTEKELDDLFSSQSGAVVCKSSTLDDRKGNELPRYSPYEYGTINSMGVPNLGYKFYMNYSNKIDKPYFQSVIPFSRSDVETMIYDINMAGTDKLVELNLSCPNIVNKTVVAYDFESLESYLDCVNQMILDNTKIGLKLPPYFNLNDFDVVSNLIKKYDNNLYFTTCINSLVNGLVVDWVEEKTLIRPKNGRGGIGGIPCKPFALANVNSFYDRIGNKIDIIGCGGIYTGIDVFEHILCGASAVQVGSAFRERGCEIFDDLNEQLRDIMVSKDYDCIGDFKGKLEVC